MKKVCLILVLILCAVFTNAQNQTASKTNANRVRIKINELPREITTVNMGKDHLGYAIKEAFITTLGNVKNYEVHITNGSTNKTLLYDNKGKFIKLLESKPVVIPKTEPVKSTVTAKSTTTATVKPAAPPPATAQRKK